MKAMCLADSDCVQKGCARDANGRLGCGYFRMNIWQFKVRYGYKIYIKNKKFAFVLAML